MNKRYIKFPYESIHSTIAVNSKDINGIKYIKPEESIIFFGTENIVGDEYKINSQKPHILQIGEDTYYQSNTDEIKEQINFQKRLDIMQQNFGNALLRLSILKSTNLKVKNYKISHGENKIYLSYDDIVDVSLVDKLEEFSNYIINANLLITNSDIDSEISIKNLGKINYVGPCLNRTGEVGLIKITSITKERGYVVVNLLAGNRAFKDYKNKFNLISELKYTLNTKDENQLLNKIKGMKK